MSHYKFSGFDTVELAREYGTPLYVMSQDIIEERAKSLRKAFEDSGLKYQIFFAGKSFMNKGMCRLIENIGLGLDVASGGELYTALEAGVDPAHIIMHGNNKSEAELKEALEAGVGRIVIDSESELRRLERLTMELEVCVPVLFRINPGVEAHTNEMINTGKSDTKFGLPLEEAAEIIKSAKDSPGIKVIGLHAHVGSQIIEEQPFLAAAKKLLELYKDLKESGFTFLKELDLGGGFGIAYTKDETAFDPQAYIPRLAEGLKELCREYKIDVPEILVEPGRYLSAEAGITLYTVGTVKHIPGLRTYVSVDGGMADNPRPALYGAEYEGVICNREMTDGNKKTVRISGKACETDTLIKKVEIAEPKEGDILAILKTGAYNYTMASNYNRLPKPAIVLLKGDHKALLCERESYKDLIAKDRIPKWLDE